MRLTAFNQRTTPVLNGTLLRVTPDLTRDGDKGEAHYTAQVLIEPEQVGRLGSLQLVAGMPAEAHIKTGERSFASYLMRPLTDHLQRAFRED